MTIDEWDRQTTGEIEIAALVREAKKDGVKHDLADMCESHPVEVDPYYDRSSRTMAGVIVAGLVGIAVIVFSVWAVASAVVNGVLS